MARPSRPPAESDLVRRAAGELSADLSASRKAGMIAARVAEAVIADVDRSDVTHIGTMLKALVNDPVAQLAIDPAIATAELLAVFRHDRMAARGWRYPSPTEVSTDLSQALESLTLALAARYRRYL